MDSNFEKFDLGSEDYQKKQEDLLKKDLELEFEEKFGDLKEDLSQDKYAQKKQAWIEDKLEEARELEDSNQRSEKALAEEREARVDTLTGLERREQLFKGLNSKVKEILNISGDPAPEEWLEKFSQERPDFSEKGEPAVLIADVSYLNLVNKLGHSKGDKLLQNAGSSFRNLGISGVRYGGDELAALLEDKEEAEAKMSQIEKDFKDQEIKELKNEYNLEPKIDTATASFSEALSAMREVMKDEELSQILFSSKHPLKVFNDMWVEIADKRSFQKKARDRIKVLLEKYQKEPEVYKKVINYLYKGAYEIEEEKIQEFLRYLETEGQEVLDREIESFIQEEEEKWLENLPENEQKQTRIILDISGKTSF